MSNTRYVNDGWLTPSCCSCGEPAGFGDEIEIVQASRREGLWMHPPCAQKYVEACARDHERFYTEILKFVRGEASDVKPGTVGEMKAKIAKDLITKDPTLASPENLRKLMAAVDAANHERAVAMGEVVTLGEEEIAACKRVH